MELKVDELRQTLLSQFLCEKFEQKGSIQVSDKLKFAKMLFLSKKSMNVLAYFEFHRLLMTDHISKHNFALNCSSKSSCLTFKSLGGSQGPTNLLLYPATEVICNHISLRLSLNHLLGCLLCSIKC